MLRPKKKISKRELKQDALVTTYANVRNFYDIHKKTISIVITAIVVAIAAVFLYVKNQTENNERALIQLSQIQSYYDNAQYQIAVDGAPERNIVGLASIVNNYGGTEGGELARLYLADSYFQLRKFSEALEQFEEYSPSSDLLRSSRYAGIAGCEESLGRYGDAAENYEKAAGYRITEAATAELLANAAHNYALAGEKEKAVDLYTRVKKNYPTTAQGREAERFITQLSL